MAAPFRASYLVNHRVFGTGGARLCEQKKDGERTEELWLESRTGDGVEKNECEVKSDGPSVRAACEEATGRKETRPVAEGQNTKSKQKPEEKTGKRGLLELLGAMKVDTTTKTKLKYLKKGTSGQESVPKPKRVMMKSTSSMFQQATSSPPPQR